MRITLTHLRYWRERQRQPSWSAGLSEHTKLVVSIDQIVNANAGVSVIEAADSTMALLRLARKNKDLISCMFSCAYGPYRHQNMKRAHQCARWLRKLGYQVTKANRK